MKTLFDRLIDQLDTLVPFLALSREDVFQILNDHRVAWFSANEDALPTAYGSYRKQINHSALLLGYSYFESFLAELLTEILRKRPAMLPKTRKLEYSEIIDSPDMKTLMDKLIEREIRELLYGNMTEIIGKLRSKYNLTITEQEEAEIVIASSVRNCIMHNSSRANSSLGVHDGFEEGQEFELSAEKVHEYGFTLRAMVRRIYEDAQRNHGINA
jgi:hypothetical protein